MADRRAEGQLPAYRLRFVAYGVTVEVRASHADFLDNVRHCLPPGWLPAPQARAGHVVSIVRDDGDEAAAGRTQVFVKRRRILDTPCRSDALRCLESHIQLHVAEMACERTFLHAGVVGWRGKAIVLPGRSGVGKSSLVAALLRAGAEYLSDEYAVIDARDVSIPMPGGFRCAGRGRQGPAARPRGIRQPDVPRALAHRPDRDDAVCCGEAGA